MSETLKQLQKKRDELAENIHALTQATKVKADDGTVAYDFEKATKDHVPEEIAKLEGREKSGRVRDYFLELNEKLNDLTDECQAAEKAEAAAKEFERRENTFKRPGMPEGEGDKKVARVPSLGELLVAHKQYKAATEGARVHMEFPDVRLIGDRKTLFQTSAGWAPESTRTGRLVEEPTRPLQIVDIIPTVPTGQAAVVYMEETTRTHSAAEVAEGGAYAEDAFVLAEQTSNVRKIGTSIPVTDEQLADVPLAEAYLDGRIRFSVDQRLDGQIVSGDGVAPNLEGIENVTGLQTQALGGDPVPDAFYKAMTKIRTTGRAIPTHHVMLPSDWEGIRLLRTADGIYIWGSPSEAGPERLWGLPVVQNESLSATTGLVGSFNISWIYLAERAGVEVEIGYVNDDFTKGKRTLRAQGRWALVITRGAAFCQVTGI